MTGETYALSWYSNLPLRHQVLEVWTVCRARAGHPDGQVSGIYMLVLRKFIGANCIASELLWQ